MGKAAVAVAKDLIGMAPPDDVVEDCMNEDCAQTSATAPPQAYANQSRRNTTKAQD